MSVEIFNSFNPSITYAQPSKNVAYATDYDAQFFPQNPDELFSTSDTKTATSTGGILLAGLTLRNMLEKWTGKFFSKFFSKNPNINPKEVLDISLNMLKDKGLMKKPQAVSTPNAQIFTDNPKTLNTSNKIKLIVENKSPNAYFDYINNEIRVSKNTLISLPHEIGHAVQEHSTKLLKQLQRFRGNYATLALILYGLGRNKSKDPKGRESWLGKIQNTLYKYNLLIPLLAYSPELITEYKASKIGIDYLKKANASKTLINAAKKHYAVAFCTYLTLPLFAIMDNFIFKKAAEKN